MDHLELETGEGDIHLGSLSNYTIVLFHFLLMNEALDLPDGENTIFTDIFNATQFI